MPILQMRRNCWTIKNSARTSVLIDASNYFKALYEVLLKAEEQILILGWDTDSRIKLLQDDAKCPTFGEFLSQILKQKPNLKIHILSWDYAFIYAFEREALPKIKFDLIGEPRLEFVLDNHHPLGASQHQKVVVIDDQIAFSGGLDITGRRWDTSEHKAYDERRIDPGGTQYAPFHDVQLAISGEAARALGDLARERWKTATGLELQAPQQNSSHFIWPESAPIFLENIEVGISRTLPLFEGRRPVYEVERLFEDSIAAARKYIYIENQYFTSDEIAKCLAARLKDPMGPEVVLVLPCDNSGWLEENTMGILRKRALDILKNADRHQRLRVFHPIVPELPEDKYLQVHSKVMIIDDKFIRVGSANLSQRSMGFDSECDLSIEARQDELDEPKADEIRNAARALRARLLAEHLDVSVAEFEEVFDRTRSLIQAVDALRGRPRTLAELNWEVPEWVNRLLPETELIDPPRPYRPWKIVRKWLSAMMPCLILCSQMAFAQAQVNASAPAPATPKTAAPVENPPKPEVLKPSDYKHKCGRVYIYKDDKLDLKDMEERLICGDPQADEIGKPWQNIPGNQAAFFLKSFLQSRAYHEPDLHIIDGNLYLKLGPRARAQSFQLKNEPSDWDIPNRRFVRGRLLDPSLLNELEGWSAYQLKVNGYACGEATAQSDPKTGEIEISLDPQKKLKIKSIFDENDTGLHGGVMERYNAFFIGDYYNQRLVDLTQRRISEDGIVSTIDFKPRCEEDGVVLLRRIDPGPSRQLRIGLGGSTDEGPRVRLNMRQTRVGSSASTAQANFDASFERQFINASYRWYYSRSQTRFFIEPVSEFRNVTEETRKEQTFDVTVFHGWQLEFRPSQLTFRVGPNYSENFLIEGVGPRRSTLTVLNADITWMDHEWEFFKTSPREGFTQTLDIVAAQEGIGAGVTAQRLKYQGQQLFNIADFDPPMAILGFRWSLGSTFAGATQASLLPTRFQFFTGGTGSLRGWESEKLPRGKAAFSEARLGTELRFYKLLFNLLDPVAFADMGKLGDVSFTLRSPTFFSPGIGLRWESPVGAVRGFVSKPIVWGLPTGEPEYDKGLRFGITLGEEF